MAGWETLTGAVVGVGVGEAASTAIDPVLEPQRQRALSDARAVVLDLGAVAALVAQGLLSQDAAHAEGLRSGYHPSRTDRAIQLALKAAPVAELLELWRRGKISEALVDHGLAKAQIEPQYWGPIKELFYGRLDPAIVATAIQRGIMRDPGFLPVGPPTAEGNVAAFPVSPLDPLEEAKAQGIDADRLFVETALVGLPLALVEAAQAYFRGIITIDDFKRAVSEGNTRNEWGDAALEVSRQILTAGEYAELQLRGYYDRQTRLRYTRKHGMSDQDSDLLYDVQGRGLSLHQAFIAERRGGVFDGPTDQIPAWAMFQLQRGNLRPEVYNLAWAGRESYPSAFVFRALLTDRVLTAEQGESYFLKLGWPTELAQLAAQHYGATATAAADSHVGKAENQLWTTLHRSYVAEETDDPTATTTLGTLGVDAAAVPQVLALWQSERDLIRKQLTPAQVKKAYREAVVNPATDSAWTRDDALAALIARGYSPNDANTFLDL